MEVGVGVGVKVGVGVGVGVDVGVGVQVAVGVGLGIGVGEGANIAISARGAPPSSHSAPRPSRTRRSQRSGSHQRAVGAARWGGVGEVGLRGREAGWGMAGGGAAVEGVASFVRRRRAQCSAAWARWLSGWASSARAM